MNYTRGINRFISEMLVKLEKNASLTLAPKVVCTFEEGKLLSGLSDSSLHDQLAKVKITARQLGLHIQLKEGIFTFEFADSRLEQLSAEQLIAQASVEERKELELRLENKLLLEWKQTEHARIDNIVAWNQVLLLEHNNE